MVISLRFWLSYGIVVAAILLWAGAAWQDPLGGTMASSWWMLTAPPSVMLVAGIGAWCEFLGDRRPGRALALVAAALACYHALQVAAPAVHGAGAPQWLLSLTDGAFAAGWMVVLTVSQWCAVVVFDRVSGQRRHGLRIFLPLALLIAVAAQVLPGELPAVAIYGWMASLVVVPLALWRAAGTLHGQQRRAAVKTTLGSLATPVVVMLCGLLAVAVAYGSTARGAEADILGTGFLMGVMLQAALFTSALRTAGSKQGQAGRPWVGGILAAVLWGFYVLAVAQLGGFVGQLLGGHPADTASATAMLGVTGFFPWRRLTVAALAFTHPWRAATAVMVAATPDEARDRPLDLARRALRAALDEPGAGIRLAGSDSAGGQAQPGPFDYPVRDSQGKVIAAVDHDGTFRDLDAIITILRPLLERAALLTEIQHQAVRLEAERQRADAARREERQRLERDLHDGVQGRILSLGLNLSIAAGQLNDPEARLVLTDTVDGLAAVLTELRGLAAGGVSDLLSSAGLGAVVADFVGRLPVPVSLDLPTGRLDPAVESVAYFVIAEAVTNAMKHAAPSAVSISATNVGGVYSLQIRDNGRGGADPRAGTGLRGLGERVHSAGGRLLVSDARPGTLVEMSLPCG